MTFNELIPKHKSDGMRPFSALSEVSNASLANAASLISRLGFNFSPDSPTVPESYPIKMCLRIFGASGAVRIPGLGSLNGKADGVRYPRVPCMESWAWASRLALAASATQV